MRHREQRPTVTLDEVDAIVGELAASQEAQQILLQGPNECTEVTLPKFVHLVLKQLHPPHVGRLSLQRRSVLWLPTVLPRHWLLRVWQWAMITLDLTYAAFITPWTLAFLSESYINSRPMYILDVLMGCMYVGDLLLKLHLACVIQFEYYKVVITNGPGILKIYTLEGQFTTDFIVATSCVLQMFMPLMVNRRHAAVQLLYVVRMLRLVRVIHVVKELAGGRLAAMSTGSFISAQTAYLISLGYCAAVTMNFLACMWYATAYFASAAGEVSLEDSWVGHAGGLGNLAEPGTDIWKRYMSALYFTVTTITTTGYGDIVPQSSLEQVVAVLIMVCGALFMSLIIGTVAGLLNSGGPEAQRIALYREKVAHLDNFVSVYPVGTFWSRWLYNHYATVWAKCEQSQREWDEIMTDLPIGMRGPIVRRLVAYSLPTFIDTLAEGVPEVILLELMGACSKIVLPAGTSLGWPGDPAGQWFLLRHGTITSTTFQQLAEAPLADPLLSGSRAALESLKASHGRLSHHHGKDPQRAVSTQVQQVQQQQQQQQQQPTVASSTDLEEGAAVGAATVDGVSLPPAASADAMVSLSHKRWHPNFHSRVGTSLSAPLVIPCGSWLDGCIPSGAATAAAGDGEGAAGNGAGSCPDAVPESEATHTSVLRTWDMCQLLAFDLPRTLDLCRACPQLRINLQRLYQQGIPAKAGQYWHEA